MLVGKVQQRQDAPAAEQCSDLVSALPLNHTHMSATDSSMPRTLSTPQRHTSTRTHSPHDYTPAQHRGVQRARHEDTAEDGFSRTLSVYSGQTQNPQQSTLLLLQDLNSLSFSNFNSARLRKPFTSL